MNSPHQMPPLSNRTRFAVHCLILKLQFAGPTQGGGLANCLRIKTFAGGYDLTTHPRKSDEAVTKPPSMIKMLADH